MTIFEKILDTVSVDPKIKDGIFDHTNTEHLNILKEFLVNNSNGEGLKEIEDFINEAQKSSEEARSKGLVYKRIKGASGWYKGNQLVGKTVKGIFKTIGEIDRDKKNKERNIELSKNTEKEPQIPSKQQDSENKEESNSEQSSKIPQKLTESLVERRIIIESIKDLVRRDFLKINKNYDEFGEESSTSSNLFRDIIL